MREPVHVVQDYSFICREASRLQLHFENAKAYPRSLGLQLRCEPVNPILKMRKPVHFVRDYNFAVNL